MAMSKKAAAGIAGCYAWHNNPDVKRENSRKGGETTKLRYGKGFYRQMRQKALANMRRRQEEATAKRLARR